jgi:drug/metabolite transporter (DMT)-like permease
MLLSPMLFSERLTSNKILGLFSALLGMFFVNGKDLIQGGFSWGLFCGAMSAVMYALMVIFNKKAVSVTGLENAICQLTVSFFIVTAFTLIKQGMEFSYQPHNIFPILFLGVVNTGIGCYLYFSSIQQISAQTVAILGFLEPLSALIFSAALLQERLTFIQIVGAFLILGGTAFGEFFNKKSRTVQ